MLSVEGVTRAPVDAGFQAGLETPIGLRFFGGYGWVPGAYKSVITNAAASATGDAMTRAVLDAGLEKGRAVRAAIGIRPFPKLGFYFDAGYTRMKLEGTLDPSELIDIPEISANTSAYSLDTTLHLWSLELGYQALVADRVVLALGVGVVKIFDSHTTALPESGQVEDPAIREATATIDDQLVRHGTIPTLTLRLGLDLI